MYEGKLHKKSVPTNVNTLINNVYWLRQYGKKTKLFQDTHEVGLKVD